MTSVPAPSSAHPSPDSTELDRTTQPHSSSEVVALEQTNLAPDLASDQAASDQAAIHTPGSIQPHGVLLALTEPDLSIAQVSQNTASILGRTAADLLQHHLSHLLSAEQVQLIQTCLNQPDLSAVNPIDLSIQIGDRTGWFDAILHRANGLLILELEPMPTEKTDRFFSFYNQMKRSIAQFQTAATLPELCQMIVQAVQTLTGFDRVMLYQFDEHWNGKVIAEALQRSSNLPPYLGLHYPATDIPEPARHLFSQNWLRMIPDVQSPPAALISTPPTQNTASTEETSETRDPSESYCDPSTAAVAETLANLRLNLSNAVLRSASPCHLQYLQNMDARASMTVSIIRHGKLWGLIACHHISEPKFVPYELRRSCEFLAQVASLEIVAKQESETYGDKMALKQIQTKLVEDMAHSANFVDGLVHNATHLLKLANATGVALYIDRKFYCVGTTPSIDQLQSLMNWLLQQRSTLTPPAASPPPELPPESLPEIFHTHSLSRLYAAANEYKAIASGLMALSISKFPQNYILWFRPEVEQTIDWAGNPGKVAADSSATDPSATDSLPPPAPLTPRQSFALWQEIVRGRSIAWQPYEIETALEFRTALVGIILRQVEELARLNQELERSNEELDAFAYIASHDLKEPLRGIHNYSSFLIEDYGTSLHEDGVAKLRTLIRLTQRMEDLIDSLLHFSRLGRVDLSIQDTDLNQVIHRILELLSARLDDAKIEIRIPRPLPTVYCDRIQVGEVFNNLISNAIKYNDKPQKWIEIGYLSSDELSSDELSSDALDRSSQSAASIVFYVKDNGIGIRQKHLDAIFRIFKRLHAASQYGGGTGAGLTIAKKIVERHGGKIWVESTLEEGSTFYFTLQS